MAEAPNNSGRDRGITSMPSSTGLPEQPFVLGRYVSVLRVGGCLHGQFQPQKLNPGARRGCVPQLRFDEGKTFDRCEWPLDQVSW